MPSHLDIGMSLGEIEVVPGSVHITSGQPVRLGPSGSVTGFTTTSSGTAGDPVVVGGTIASDNSAGSSWVAYPAAPTAESARCSGTCAVCYRGIFVGVICPECQYRLYQAVGTSGGAHEVAQKLTKDVELLKIQVARLEQELLEVHRQKRIDDFTVLPL